MTLYSFSQTEKQAQYLKLLSLFFLLETMAWGIPTILSYSDTLRLAWGSIQALWRKVATTAIPQAGQQDARVWTQWPLGPHLTWLLCNISCKAGDEFSWVRCHHPECQVLWDLCQRLLLCNSLCKLEVLSCQGMKDAITSIYIESPTGL